MAIVSGAMSVIAACMTGSAFPTHCAIGRSGGTVNTGNTALGSEFDRNAHSSTDLSVAGEVTFVTDFSATEMSGTVLREFGTFTTGSTMLNHETLTGSATFTGDEELQIRQTFKLFI